LRTIPVYEVAECEKLAVFSLGLASFGAGENTMPRTSLKRYGTTDMIKI
jgi:hypothetical protein